MWENWCSTYEGFIIMQFLNTRVPEMVHPTKNVLGSNTSHRRKIFRLISHRINDPTTTVVAP